jgi:hypothetical protein
MKAQSKDRERVDDALEALSNSYRRQLLLALLFENPQDDTDCDPLDILDDAAKADLLETQLVHAHLPKLQAMGFIDWDRESGSISKGPDWDRVGPLLTLIHNHQDELPVGFL